MVAGWVPAEVSGSCDSGVAAAGYDTWELLLGPVWVPVDGAVLYGADAISTGSRLMDGSHPVLGSSDSFGVTPIVSYNFVVHNGTKTRSVGVVLAG